MIRRKTTKDILGESVHELAQQKSVNKISVKEITDNCGLSTTTFYHHFRDKYELIAWMYNYQMEDIFLDFYEGTESWHQALLDMVTILDQDRSFYKNALKNTEGPDSFFQATHLRSIELAIDVIKRSINGPVDEEIMFYIKFYLRGVSHSITDWFLNDLPYSTELLADCLYQAMPEKLKPFLI